VGTDDAFTNVPGSFSWTPTTTVPTVNISSYPAIFTPDDNVNYNTVSGLAFLTVNKAIPSIDWPNTNHVIVFYNPMQTLANIDLDGGNANGGGSFAWTTPKTVPVVGNDGYSVTLTPTDTDNYDFTGLTTEIVALTIHPANQTITGLSNLTRTYGDDSFNLSATASSGLTVTYTSNDPSVATISENIVTIIGAGTTTITASQSGNSNYNAAPDINRTLIVEKAVLTVRAHNKQRIFGKENPEFTFEYLGFIPPDDELIIEDAPELSTTATLDTPPGRVPITIKGGSHPNYSFRSVNGTLTIVPDRIPKTYGDIPFEIPTIDPINDLKVIDISEPSIKIDIKDDVLIATILKSTPSTTVTINSENPISLTVTIDKAKLEAKADNYVRKQGAQNPVFTISYKESDFKYGDNKDNAIGTPPMITCEAVPSSREGSYPIKLSGGSAENYDFVFYDGRLEVVAGEKLPTAFTPNNDGFNEIFLEGYEIQIFNRWGSLLYSGKDGWDGKYKGRVVEAGIYFYISTSPLGIVQRGTIEVIKK